MKSRKAYKKQNKFMKKSKIAQKKTIEEIVSKNDSVSLYDVDFDKLNQDHIENTSENTSEDKVEEIKNELLKCDDVNQEDSKSKAFSKNQATSKAMPVYIRPIDEIVNIGSVTNSDSFQIKEVNDTTNTPLLKLIERPSIPQTPLLNGQRIVRSDCDKLNVRAPENLFTEKMIINRYPGKLFIEISKIERFMANNEDIEEISIKIESTILNYETKRYKVWSNIDINDMIQIPIASMPDSGYNMRFVLILHHKNRSLFFGSDKSKTCELNIKIDADKIYSVHNNLVESNNRWDHYSSKNPLRNLKNFFVGGPTDAWSLKTYMSFISDDEVPFIPVSLPVDLLSLSKWLTVKKFSYNMWFRGFVNLRGDFGDVCTHLWKRRYIKCYGYSMFIFNEHSRNLIGTINLVDASFDKNKQKGIYFGNFISLDIGYNLVELHFDTKEKYEICQTSLATMLPPAIFGKKS